MNQDHFDRSIFDIIKAKAIALEEILETDVIFFNGSISPYYFRAFRDFIEQVEKKSKNTQKAISVIIRTGGGSAETTEKMVAYFR